MFNGILLDYAKSVCIIVCNINQTDMAEVKFYLEKRKDKDSGEVVVKNVPILLFFSFEGQRLQHYTGQRIDTAKWDTSTMRVKRNCAEASSVNKELDKLKAKIADIYDKAKALEVKVSIQYFKDKLNDKKTSVSVTSKKSFEDYFEEFLESSKITKGGNTMRSLKSVLNVFKDFAKQTGVTLSFENINQDFYNKFLEYCFHVRGLKNNSTGKHIKDLKAFLNYATDKEYNTNLAYKKKSFKRLVEEPEIIYLTYDELIGLYEFELNNKRLEQIRDIFCFGCFTGMRFSDIKALAPEHIHDDFITYRVVKTGANNTIPLNPYSRAIIERYKGHPVQVLPVISEVKTNLYLKELAGFAKLNRSIQQNHFQGAKRITTNKPLYEIITFHVSKKTFMTNFLAKGGSLHTAMAITGNKDMKSARRYFKVVDTLKADEMKKVFGG